MKRSSAEARKEYDEMTAEELELELRKAFFCTDQIDGPLSEELERIREALDRKRPVEYLYTPEESWAQFRADHGDESGVLIVPQEEPETGEIQVRALRHRTVPALLRRVLIAAAVVVVLTGAALAANSLGLVAWIRGWSDNPERYAQTGFGSPGPIKEALQDLGIDDPVYPAWLPSNYILTETLISKDPLLLYELYTKADRYVSITITPISAANTAIYPQGKWLQEKNQPGKPAHYIFSNDESITVVWYTENYFTSISSNITAGAMERIIESVYTGQTKGEN